MCSFETYSFHREGVHTTAVSVFVPETAKRGSKVCGIVRDITHIYTFENCALLITHYITFYIVY